MKFHQFFEARREVKEARKKGQQPPTRLSDYEELEKYKNKSDIFISFRSIDKIGINPLSKFRTPNGIYTYPLKEMFKKWFNNEAKIIKVPFAGQHPYIYVIQKNKKSRGIDDLSKYSDSDYKNDLDKLIKIYGEDKIKELSQNISGTIESGGQMYESFAYKLWSLTRLLSGENNPVKWNRIFVKDLGYNYAIDRKGEGIIHTAERVQAVFFNITSFKVIDKVVKNSRRKEVSNNMFKGTLTKLRKREAFRKKQEEKNKVMPWNGKKDGVWEDKVWYDGIWEDGVWASGTWKNGKWLKGFWNSGVWEDGTWHDGEWKDGRFKEGMFLNGTWYDGIWEGGIWKGGEWKTGLIYDPKRKGNYKTNWKWKGDYVQSPISPKEYFKK